MKRLFILITILIFGGLLLRSAGVLERPNTTDTQTEAEQETITPPPVTVQKVIQTTDTTNDTDTTSDTNTTNNTDTTNNKETLNEESSPYTVIDTEEPNIVSQEENIIPNDVVKVYLYEWGIDVLNSNIHAGTVQFEIYNIGRRSHRFGVVGIQDFGKIKPGTRRTFGTQVDSGEITLYSPIRIDQQYGMMKSITVQ